MKPAILFQLSILLIVAILLSACAGQGTSLQNGPQTLAGGGNEPGVPVGTRPPMVTVGPEGGDPGSGKTGGGLISSSGTQIAPAAPQATANSSGLVLIEGSEGQAAEGTYIPSPNLSWLTYTDRRYGFSLLYPDTYVILPEVEPGNYMGQKAAYQVRFQEKDLASGDLADLEPPKFTLEVYETGQPVDVQAWLTNQKLIPARSKVEPVKLQSGLAGVRVVLDTLNSPNTFYFLASGSQVYRVIPIGPEAEQMLASLK